MAWEGTRHNDPFDFDAREANKVKVVPDQRLLVVLYIERVICSSGNISFGDILTVNSFALSFSLHLVPSFYAFCVFAGRNQTPLSPFFHHRSAVSVQRRWTFRRGWRVHRVAAVFAVDPCLDEKNVVPREQESQSFQGEWLSPTA